jgi:hypothetical protein
MLARQIRPDASHQFFFGYFITAALNQRQQEIKSFGTQLDYFTAAPEQTLVRVELKAVKAEITPSCSSEEAICENWKNLAPN